MKTNYIDRAIEVNVPASTAYNVWTQFELFPAFMEDVEEVEQLDERRLRWKAKVLGKVEEWVCEITEQIPDKRIAWRSTDGPSHAGVVTFHRLDEQRTRIMLQMGYTPDAMQKVADALGIFTRRIDKDLTQFKEYAEMHGDDIDGWRGEIPSLPDAKGRR
jgi:uncharacterized membrane protein